MAKKKQEEVVDAVEVESAPVAEEVEVKEPPVVEESVAEPQIDPDSGFVIGSKLYNEYHNIG